MFRAGTYECHVVFAVLIYRSIIMLASSSNCILEQLFPVIRRYSYFYNNIYKALIPGISSSKTSLNSMKEGEREKDSLLISYCD